MERKNVPNFYRGATTEREFAKFSQPGIFTGGEAVQKTWFSACQKPFAFALVFIIGRRATFLEGRYNFIEIFPTNTAYTLELRAKRTRRKQAGGGTLTATSFLLKGYLLYVAF